MGLLFLRFKLRGTALHCADIVLWITTSTTSASGAGGIIGVHGDDMGLRLPPLMAPLQVVVVPILRKKCDVDAIRAAAEGLVSAAKAAGVRAHLDDDDTKSPGFRFSHWEQKVERAVPRHECSSALVTSTRLQTS